MDMVTGHSPPDIRSHDGVHNELFYVLFLNNAKVKMGSYLKQHSNVLIYYMRVLLYVYNFCLFSLYVYSFTALC